MQSMNSMSECFSCASEEKPVSVENEMQWRDLFACHMKSLNVIMGPAIYKGG